MAVASDVGTGTIAVSCEDRQSRVYFPYVDDRVPCENNVVRTLSNNRTVDDSRADSNSPLTAAVMAAGTNVAAEKEGENAAQPQGAVNRSNSKEGNEEKEKESSAPAVVPSPQAVLGIACGGSALIFRDVGVTSVVFDLGRTSGTFNFSYNGGGNPAATFADTFDVIYEGSSLSGFPITTGGAATVPLTYSGSSTTITVVVTPSTTVPAGGSNAFSFAVACPSGSSAPHSASTFQGTPPDAYDRPAP
jgi:hypothetical protein